MRHTIWLGVLAALFSITGAGCVAGDDADDSPDEQPADDHDPVLRTRRDGTTVASGRDFSCAVKGDGTVWCWGSNHWESWFGPRYGKLGNGSTVWNSFQPVPVTGVNGAIAVSLGDDHGCALRADGRVQCWGRNGAGQLGDGTTVDRATAVLAGVDNVIAIATSAATTCAVRADTLVMCWGANSVGQVGNYATGGAVLTPSYVRTAGYGYLSGATHLAAGDNHFCVTDSWGGAACWGANQRAQLGDRTTTNRPYAVTVIGVSGVLDVATGWAHTCALTRDGGLAGFALWCWGDDTRNQMGQFDGPSSAIQVSPVRVNATNGRGVLDIEGGGYTTCVIDQTGHSFSFGEVITVRGYIDDAVSIECATFHGCAMTATGAVSCWGQNDQGQLGRPPVNNLLYQNPGWVAGLDGGRSPSGVAAGYGHTCAQVGGVARCWGSNVYGQLGDGTTTSRSTPAPVAGGPSPKGHAAGAQFSCRLDGDGAVWCWGAGSYGNLGTGGTGNASTPVRVVTGARDLAAGGAHACAIKQDVYGADEIWCWGYNAWGQLGDGTTANRLVPTRIDPAYLPARPVQLTAGYVHSCALLTDGTVWCWGYNGSGQLGDNTTTGRYRPVRVANLAAIAQIDAGAFHTCAVSAANGYLFCWGSNYNGQLGDGTTTDRHAPAWVPLYSPRATSVAAGAGHSCATTSDGGAYCWGYNAYGTLGDGTATTSYYPVRVSKLSNLVSLDAGWYHTCAVTGSGAPWCWGWNGYGQLGDGTTATRYAPVAVGG